MNDQEYIRKAVQLVDGWELNGGWIYTPFGRYYDNYDPSTGELDALAAQLVRQVDALPNTKDGRMEVFVTSEDTDVFLQAKSGLSGYYKGALIRGKDRTMNTIKAIVDSEVLDNG